MRHLKTITVGAVLLSGLFFFLSSIFKRDLGHHLENEVAPVVTNGQIVMRSFQANLDNATLEVPETASTEIIRGPATAIQNNQLAQHTSGKLSRLSNPNTDTPISINGNSYVWLKNMYAVPAPGKTDNGAPSGFEFVSEKPRQDSVFEYNKRTLNVLQNELGEKFVVSGSIVVESKALTGSQISKLANMPLLYDASQISTYILQARDGQDLEKAIEALRSNPSIARAEIELLGRGKRAQ